MEVQLPAVVYMSAESTWAFTFLDPLGLGQVALQCAVGQQEEAVQGVEGAAGEVLEAIPAEAGKRRCPPQDTARPEAALAACGESVLDQEDTTVDCEGQMPAVGYYMRWA